MRSKFPVGFRAWCVAIVLGVGSIAHAAEQHPLMGATREQVLSRYGEPRSTLVGGGREVLFYGRERLTLRNGVVVDVERLASEPVRRPAPTPTPAPVPAPTPASDVAPAPVAPAAPAPATDAATIRSTMNLEPVLRTAPPATSPLDGVAVPASPPPSPADAAPLPPPAPEPKLEIKRVLPPGSGGTRSSGSPASAPRVADTAVAAAATASKSPSPVPATPAPAPRETPVTVPAAATPPTAGALADMPARTSGEIVSPNVADAVAVPAEDDPEVAAKDKVGAGKKKAAQRALEMREARRRLEAATQQEVDPATAFFSTRTYVITFVIVVGGLGYLVWRRRQRQIELAATAVSHSPFSAPVPTVGGSVFTADLISKLEWKHFEELVAAYYAKTGVVATRTKAGPATPVHIKISWKGEPRPFALVQCIAQPQGLVDAKPIQELTAVLMAEDIRRGYVVTSGKFNVAARDFAEEKHITLLPGDIFLEKLNALPDAARAEILHQITAGDFTTPACPKCEAKMARGDEPGVWRCAAHTDQRLLSR